MKKWLTQREVAELEGISRQAVTKRLKKGEYRTRIVPGKGGRGGIRTEIHLSGLSTAALEKKLLAELKEIVQRYSTTTVNKTVLYQEISRLSKKALTFTLKDIFEAVNRNRK